MIKSKLLDARNWDVEAPPLIEKIRQAKIIGFDIETEQSKRHEGLATYSKSKLVFDTRRSTVTGFSIYVDGDDTAWYVNLAHADVANRIPWSEARQLLDAKSEEATWIIHNAPYELVMMKNCLGFEIKNYLCSMQLCVSAYNSDEYPVERFFAAGLGNMAKLIGPAAKAFSDYFPGDQMDQEQARIFSQIAAKDSTAEHSYNGHIRTIRYGYGLKEAVERWFGHRMTTYEEVVGNGDMGDLTGEQVTAYGADDAYWCVRLFHRVLQHIMQTNPKVMDTFLKQEMPMVQVYADVWREGLRVDRTAVLARRDEERALAAKVLRRLKAAVRELLPFKPEPHEGLMREKWYKDNYQRYRDRITAWASLPDSSDDQEQVLQCSGAVAASWTDTPKLLLGPNWTHYMPIRTLMYDLLGQKLILEKGKVQSDGEARGKMIDRLEDPIAIDAIRCINELAGIEQRMKLYLTPYSHLIDPETERVYPVLSSMLNTRRMATSFPNPMQLAKRGESTYIRGFYLADEEDHLIVSLDWSQVELVLVGDQSGDPEFKKVYGQLPYEDLHTGATVDCLQVLIPELSLEMFQNLHKLDPRDIPEKVLIRPDGSTMSPEVAKKFWRTEVGKGANFSYWYSGALSEVGRKLGWTPDQMWSATERYRERFSVAEEWRIGQIQFCQENGYVELPDGHRRTRFEATPVWAQAMRNFFGAYDHIGVTRFSEEVIRAINRRAKNQAINALIQGTCATLAKRTIINLKPEMKHLRARFMLPVHDELVFSVHHEDVIDFLRVARPAMTTHPEIVKTLPLDCTASIGRTFEPWHPERAPFGQIEVDEAPDFLGLPAGERCNEDQIRTVIDYMMK